MDETRLAELQYFRPGIDAHHLSFTGSGSQYMRVWLINLLLTVLTLGVYWPYARRWSTQYFHAHTLVAGAPLEFRQRVTMGTLGGGLALVGLALLGGYAGWRHTLGPEVLMRAVLITTCLVLPIAWSVLLRGQMGASGWRDTPLTLGMRWRRVAVAFWPLYLLVCALLLAPQVERNVQALLLQHDLGQPQRDVGLLAQAVLALLLTGLAWGCLIQLRFNLLRLKVRAVRMGHHRGRWRVPYADFAYIWLRSGLLFAACLAGAVSLGIALLPWLDRFLVTTPPRTWPVAAADIPWAWGAGVVLLVWIWIGAPARAYRDAQVFRLVWNGIGLGHIARFRCELNIRAFVGLRVRNLVLSWLSLGLYRPYARVAEHAMKVDSITLFVKGSVDYRLQQLALSQNMLDDGRTDLAALESQARPARRGGRKK